MKIEINLKIIIVIILFFLLNNLEMYLMFFIFILLHELAHLFVGILMGGIPKRMYINPFGMSLEFYSYGKNLSLNRIIFFLIGPLLNIILAIIFFYLNIENLLKEKIVYTNLAIGLFNLLPVLPLDGGKILKEIFSLIVRSKYFKRNYDKIWQNCFKFNICNL